jgi:class 3 adenylate cyclase
MEHKLLSSALPELAMTGDHIGDEEGEVAALCDAVLGVIADIQALVVRDAPIGSRWTARHALGAQYLESPGDVHCPFVGGQDADTAAVEEFLTGHPHKPEPDRVLMTVLLTDVVCSTEHAAELGDRRWRKLLDAHDRACERELGRFGGQQIKHTGDGLFAAFSGPARAIRCALAIREALRDYGLEIRASIHAGECERRGRDLSGIAVHIAARIMALAEAGDVVVSRTVADLIAGSQIRLADCGEHELRGVRGSWRVYRVEVTHP